MAVGTALNTLYLVLSAVLLVLCLTRYFRALPESRSCYKWSSLALLGLSGFLTISIGWGDVTDRIGLETLAGLGAILAPAWAAMGAAHLMTARRAGERLESPTLILASLVLVFTYGAAKALAITP